MLEKDGYLCIYGRLVFLHESKIFFFSLFSGHGFDKEGYDTLIEAQYKAVTEMQPSEYQYMSAHLDCNKVCNFFFHPC